MSSAEAYREADICRRRAEFAGSTAKAIWWMGHVHNWRRYAQHLREVEQHDDPDAF